MQDLQVSNQAKKEAVVYLGLSKTSLMELFCENNQRLKALYYFYKANVLNVSEIFSP